MDIARIYAAELASGKTPAEARQGTRTTVQGLLHEASPSPYADHPPQIAQGKVGLTPEEVETIRLHQHGQVTHEEMIASETARLGPDSTHVNAHHFVQKMHQKSLWEEADRLVTAALGGVS